ncbi:MAG: hypothetical protein JWO88_3356 [Frankiales bacterium]|nr:hypothetical protein [Frankiales bacterium]
MQRHVSLRRRPVPYLALLGVAAGVLVGISHSAGASTTLVRSSFAAKDGRTFSVTNHLVTNANVSTASSAGHRPHEWLVVWAGDANAADSTGASISHTPLAVNPVRAQAIDGKDAPPGPDFLAVIDADRDSATYGKVVNTATVGPLVENEPHHMQYIFHKGDSIFAGGLYSDVTYVFDVKKLPQLSLSGVNQPTDTPCGSIPDAYWVLKDHTAYGTYMGGPDVPGPCQYTDGQTRIGNGFGGSPGSIVHVGTDGSTLSETPAALPTSEDPVQCINYPVLPQATCANPHGIQVREDLNRLVASDYAEPRNIVLDPVKPQDANLFRNTVRIFDISKRNDPRLVSVSTMPDGPRVERNPGHEEPRGIMEATVTNLPGHKGAFAESMCGGVIYYTPDITLAKPKWREVFDDTRAARQVDPEVTEGGGCDGGGWLQTSLDDKYLYHAVIGRSPGSLDTYDTGSAKMVYTLDIAKLLESGRSTTCSIDHISEVYDGGAESDCPTLTSVLPVKDLTSGGPHWGTLDNFVRGSDGYFHETRDVQRIAISDYFVARTGVDGDHKVCMVNVDGEGHLTLDRSFRDENEGTPCVDFNRTSWPHGDYGNAKPHSELFVVSDADLR